MPKKVEFTKAGQPDTIRVVEMAMPEPKQGQVRVKVEFAGINFRPSNAPRILSTTTTLSFHSWL